jgi:hypothetical protein
LERIATSMLLRAAFGATMQRLINSQEIPKGI